MLAYALIVIDASLFPFSGWRDLGLTPFDFLSAPWPPRALPFDFAANALGYLPLGFVAGLALHPRFRNVALVAGAVLICALLSIGLEALQTYLPARVASKVDVLSNVAGGTIGALFAARFAHPLLDTGRLRVVRARWFVSSASRGMVLILVWFGALVYPDAFVFGTGGVLKVVEPAWSDALAAMLGVADSGVAEITTARFLIAEAVVSGLALTAAAVLFCNLLRPTARWWLRLLLVAAFVASTVFVKGVAHAFLIGDGWPPFTPGARIGIVAACLSLPLVVLLPIRMRWALGLASLVGAVVLVNVYPDNPYGTSIPLAWTRGRLMNFYGLATGLNLVWPFLAIAYFLRHRGRERPRGRAGRPL